MQTVADIEQENSLLKENNNNLKEKVASLEEQLHLYQEMLRHLKQKRFGTSSEKHPAQLGLFNEAEETVTVEIQDDDEAKDILIEVAAHQRNKKPRVSLPKDLPREDIIYDLPEAEKICPHDGTILNNIGSEDHEQLDIIPAQVKVLRHRRQKYACPCCQRYIITAKKPQQPIEKSIASPGLLAHITTQKFCDGMPLYRQTQAFKRINIELDRTNMSFWMVRVGQLIQPLINLLQERLLEQCLVQMDETPLQVLREPGKPAQSKSYMWLMASFVTEPIILFHYSPSRSQTTPLDQLNEHVPALMVDGYNGYQPACDAYEILRLGCWAHARRKFVEAQKLQPKGKTGKPDQALAFIQKLYRIETMIKDEPPDKRYQLRQQQAKPIIDKLKAWLEKNLPNVPPKTALGKALQYLYNQWHRLIHYLDDGHYPIDNNLAENALRPFVIGRKNWLFSTSQAGAKASANLYSLIETAKAQGINPYEYLKHVFKVLPNANTLEDIERLLPSEYKNSLSNS